MTCQMVFFNLIQNTPVGKMLFVVKTFDPDSGVGGIDSFKLNVNQQKNIALGQLYY